MSRVRLLAAMCLMTLAIAPLGTASVQAQAAGQKGSVTIFTDGLAYPNGRVSRAFTELSAEFHKAGKIRILPIMAYGGEANVRDLLDLRGADLAVVNSDVLAAPSLGKLHTEARRKLRYVTKLYTQKVFLLARPEIASIDQLAGKKVAVLGSDTVARPSAETIFSLLKIEPELFDLQEGVGPSADTHAVFLLEDDAKRLMRSEVPASDFRLLPISRNSALAPIYAAAQIQPAEAGEYNDGFDAIDTIALDTVLATFDWAPSQARHRDVNSFIDGLFEALPKLRQAYPTSLWQDADPHAPILGWRPYSYAEEAKDSVPPVAAATKPEETLPAPETSTVALVPEAEATPSQPAAPAASAPTASPLPDQPGGMPLRLSILAHPPLTDQTAPGGGLIGELTIAAMERAERPYNRNLDFQWEKDKVSQIKALLSSKTAELGVPWEKPSCDEPQGLGMETAALCDGALASEPIFKVLVLFFMRNDSDFSFATDESLSGRTICLPTDRDVSSLGELGRKLLADGKLNLVRPASLIECLDVVQRGDADAVLTTEMEGKLAIARLGLSRSFRIADRPVSAQDMTIMLAKDTPEAERLLAALNKGIAKLKSDGLYFQIVAKHLAQIDAASRSFHELSSELR